MPTWYRFSFLTTVAAFGAVLFAIQIGSALPGFAQQKPQTVMVFKTATCGCCSNWVDHMKAAGFQLKVQDVEDIAAVKSRLGVAPEISSCHTSQVDGYVIEGHVPASAVQRLLKERPKVTGLAVPGMPMGSPGMEVPSGQKDSYAVIAFGGGQPSRVYERH